MVLYFSIDKLDLKIKTHNAWIDYKQLEGDQLMTPANKGGKFDEYML